MQEPSPYESWWPPHGCKVAKEVGSMGKQLEMHRAAIIDLILLDANDE